MCSELSVTSITRRSHFLRWATGPTARAALLIVLTGTLVACGNKKPPTPPPSRIPAPPTDLRIQQRGNEFILRLSYPSVTMAGTPLEEIENIEVWELVRVVPQFEAVVDEIAEDVAAADGLGQGPVELPEEEPLGLLFQVPTEVLDDLGLSEEAKESLIYVDPREYPKLATLRATLTAEDIGAASEGDDLTVHIPIAAAEGEEEQGSVMAARVKSPGRRPSPFSNLVTLVPREAPDGLASIDVTPTDRGVMIAWEAVDEEDEEIEGYRVYRRSPKSKEYGEHLISLPTTMETYTDTTATFGVKYIYTVTTVSSSNPLVESAITAEKQVNFRDRFPPLPPRNLVAFPEPGQVRLLWDAPTAEDVEGYLIYRRGLEGDFRLVDTDLVKKAEFLDPMVTSGGVYRYMVRAVDGAGNESEPSEEIEVRVP